MFLTVINKLVTRLKEKQHKEINLEKRKKKNTAK